MSSFNYFMCLQQRVSVLHLRLEVSPNGLTILSENEYLGEKVTTL